MVGRWGRSGAESRIVGLVALASIMLPGCLRYEGNPQGERVAVVGNSIVDHSRSQVGAELGRAGYAHHVAAEGGIAIPGARERLLPKVLASKPAILVIELGINDAMTGWNSADLVHLERVLRDLDAVPCVVWVTPDAQDPGPTWWDGASPDGSTLNERLALFEASLRKRLPAHPNIHHADWGEEQLDEHYQSDRLHPSPSGKQALAEYIVRSVGEFC